MSDRKEELILKYLELTYGKKKVYDNEKSIGIGGVCIYHKNVKQVGFVGEVHLDLVNWFGEQRYYPQLRKWFSNKFNVEVI